MHSDNRGKSYSEQASNDSSDKTDEKTEVLTGVQETLNREMQRAKQQEACLIVIRGPSQGQRYFLTQDEMIIGRDPRAEIAVPDKSISRQHARLFKKEGRVLINDLNSANGTIINGQKMPKEAAVPLGKEDMIRLGNVIMKFLPAGEYEILFYGEMDSKAYTDALTQISNKRYLEERLEAEFKRAKALGDELAVIFFDIDFFKKLNDSHGHAAGDFVLRELAQIIRGQFIGPKDVFARYGGEEFVIALAKTNAEKAGKISETIRASIEAHAFIFEGKRLPVTISMGVAELETLTTNTHSLLKKADQAAYESKNRGRNRVTVAS